MIESNIGEHFFELGPIRPPSEAYSLLIRATRNCPWGKCEFCPIYKEQKFELRTVEEVQHDIAEAKAILDEIETLAQRTGNADNLRALAATVHDDPRSSSCVRNVAVWVYGGQKSAFLQDANTLCMKTPQLVQILACLRETFPQLERVTTYGRSKTASKKTLDELQSIYQAGLSRIHVGLESGSDEVLSFMNKGVTAEEQIKGGKQIVASGISLCEYVMPGLGGKRMRQSHIEGTANVLNEIGPQFVRLRTLEVRPGMSLWEKTRDHTFELLTEDEVVKEIGQLVERINCRTFLKSDHMLNLLSEVEGKLPDDKQAILDVINKYLSLSLEDRLNFRVGKRVGHYHNLRDFQDSEKRDQVEQVIYRFKSRGQNDLESLISMAKEGFI